VKPYSESIPDRDSRMGAPKPGPLQGVSRSRPPRSTRYRTLRCRPCRADRDLWLNTTTVAIVEVKEVSLADTDLEADGSGRTGRPRSRTVRRASKPDRKRTREGRRPSPRVRYSPTSTSFEKTATLATVTISLCNSRFLLSCYSFRSRYTLAQASIREVIPST
jgi:hypothetical protein